MADQPADRARAAAGPLWFLADRDAFLRRFVLRTLLEPPRARRAGPLRQSPRRWDGGGSRRSGWDGGGSQRSD